MTRDSADPPGGDYEGAIPVLEDAVAAPRARARADLRIRPVQPRAGAEPRRAARGGDPDPRAAPRVPGPDRPGPGGAGLRLRERGHLAGGGGGRQWERQRLREGPRTRTTRARPAEGSQATLRSMATATDSVHDVCVEAKEASRAWRGGARGQGRRAARPRRPDRRPRRRPDRGQRRRPRRRARGGPERGADRPPDADRGPGRGDGGGRPRDRRAPDPVGEIAESWTLPNGLDVRKQRAPLGVIGIVYEARPNVTIDAAALCIKSGNGVVLRGSSAAETSNVMLASLVTEALAAAGLPRPPSRCSQAAGASSSASWRPRRGWST